MRSRLLGSINGKYLSVNLKKALLKVGDKLVILYGDKMENAEQIIAGYKNINPSVKALAISSTKFLPHMERPDTFTEVYSASRKL